MCKIPTTTDSILVHVYDMYRYVYMYTQGQANYMYMYINLNLKNVKTIYVTLHGPVQENVHVYCID